jgi:hypothetical protein
MSLERNLTIWHEYIWRRIEKIPGRHSAIARRDAEDRSRADWVTKCDRQMAKIISPSNI